MKSNWLFRLISVLIGFKLSVLLSIAEIVTYNDTVNNISYIIDTEADSAAVKGMCNPYGAIFNLVIPDEIEFEGAKYPVIAIADKAFRNKDKITGSLIIGNNVRTIGRYAFDGCTGFTGSLIIPNSVQTIGRSAFNYCIGFTGSLTIGNNVQTIEKEAFFDCSGLTGSLEIPNSVQSIGDHAFHNCIGFTGSLIIPNSVQEIGSWAFGECTGFNGSLIIGESVHAIGYCSFFGCSGFIGSLTIPRSVQVIDQMAFDGVIFDYVTSESIIPPSISEPAIPHVFDLSQYSRTLYVPFESVDLYCTADIWKEFRYVNKQVLFYKGQNDLLYVVETNEGTAEVIGLTDKSRSISSLRIPDDIEYKGIKFPVVYIAANAFKGNNNIKGSLTIGKNVQGIGMNAFYGCTGFTGSLIIPDSVQEVREWAFNCCGFNGSLTIGKSVKTIGNGAFSGCSDFTGSLIIPNSVQSIGDDAFHNCKSFTGSLTLPNSVQTIGDYAFQYCSGFSGSLEIPNSVQLIGAYAFSNCTGFNGSLILPNSIVTIGEYTFYNCTKLSGSLCLPNSIETIGIYAFYGCSGFSGFLEVSKSVREIGYKAFDNTLFEYIKSQSIIPPSCIQDYYQGQYTFSSLQYEKNLYVPAESIDNYRTAIEWRKFKNILDDGLSAIENIPADNGISIDADERGVTVKCVSGQNIFCYSLDGRMVHKIKADSDHVIFELAKGIYMISVSNITKKIVIN
ncbi:MAG: leucine-rich repeat domain-containing protein [Bacteroides sp.]|nr:leucine-rich repeat domain-containing protein [Bacteroides sp.]MCM1413907.1 leucine-rich repeat domain-containing protein [Bacteroides sp.]